MLIDPSNSHCQINIGDSGSFHIELYSFTVILKLDQQELEDLIKKIKTRLNLSLEAEEFLYSIREEIGRVLWNGCWEFVVSKRALLTTKLAAGTSWVCVGQNLSRGGQH